MRLNIPYKNKGKIVGWRCGKCGDQMSRVLFDDRNKYLNKMDREGEWICDFCDSTKRWWIFSSKKNIRQQNINEIKDMLAVGGKVVGVIVIIYYVLKWMNTPL